MLAQNRRQGCLGRIGVQHQIGLGLPVFVIREGVVQQVVQDLAIEFRTPLQFGAKYLQCRALIGIFKTHPQGHTPQLSLIAGQGMGLQIEHDLQAMFELAKEGIVFFENRAFLMRQAANLLECRDRIERIGSANLTQITAVE